MLIREVPDIFESVATDSARKEYNENKSKDSDKPNIVFKPRSKLKLTPKNKSKPGKDNLLFN